MIRNRADARVVTLWMPKAFCQALQAHAKAQGLYIDNAIVSILREATRRIGLTSDEYFAIAEDMKRNKERYGGSKSH